MGGLGGLLGHLATGYDQAAQIDKQRAFENEMATRQQAGDFLQKIAMDESVHPDVRNAALQERLNIPNLPITKQYKMDPHKIGLFRPNLSTPTAPPEQQVGAQGAQVPVFGNPPPAPQMSTPAPPPGDIAGTFATPSEQTNILAHRAGAVTGAQLGAQIGTREKAIQSGASPLALGLPVGSLTRATGTGGGFAKDLRAQGLDVPAQYPDEQWINMREMLGGNSFTPGTPPSGQYSINAQGKAEPKYQAQVEKEQREFGIWHQKNQVQFGQQLAKQQVALQDAVDRGDHAQAVKIHNDAIVTQATAQRRAQIMDQSLADVQAAAAEGKPADQQAMLNILANHVLMTTGAGEKGATRATQAMFKEAQASAPWLQRVKAKFDKNGYLTGVTLTPDQMENMVALAHEKVGVMKDNADTIGETFKKELTFRHPNQPTKTLSTPSPPPSSQPTYVRIKASDGSLHDIPSDKMDLAKKRDPGLQVVK